MFTFINVNWLSIKYFDSSTILLEKAMQQKNILIVLERQFFN